MAHSTTTRYTVGPDNYTQVATGVQHVYITETLVGGMRVVVQQNGTAPTVDHSNYMNFDKSFEWSDGSFDVYVMSPNGVSSVGVLTR